MDYRWPFRWPQRSPLNDQKKMQQRKPAIKAYEVFETESFFDNWSSCRSFSSKLTSTMVSRWKEGWIREDNMNRLIAMSVFQRSKSTHFRARNEILTNLVLPLATLVAFIKSIEFPVVVSNERNKLNLFEHYKVIPIMQLLFHLQEYILALPTALPPEFALTGIMWEWEIPSPQLPTYWGK